MSEPPENAKGAAPKDRAQRKRLAKAFDSASSVKASGPRRIAQWFAHALCLTELATTNPRALKMLRVHLEAMREELA